MTTSLGIFVVQKNIHFTDCGLVFYNNKYLNHMENSLLHLTIPKDPAKTFNEIKIKMPPPRCVRAK